MGRRSLSEFQHQSQLITQFYFNLNKSVKIFLQFSGTYDKIYTNKI